MDLILLATKNETAYKVGYYLGYAFGILVMVGAFALAKLAFERGTAGWTLCGVVSLLLGILMTAGFVYSIFVKEDEKPKEPSDETTVRQIQPQREYYPPPRPQTTFPQPRHSVPQPRTTIPRPRTLRSGFPRPRTTMPPTSPTPRQKTPRPKLEYSITIPEPFQLTRNFANQKTYTYDGQYPIQDVTQPVFTVDARSFPVGSRDRVEFAKRQLNFLHGFTDAQVDEDVREVTIDGLKGHEMVATGTHFMTDTPVIVYQVMLFDEMGYYVIRGMVATAQASKYGNSFLQIAQSFKRKPTDGASRRVPAFESAR